MSGRKSRSKGYRAENNLVHELKRQGIESKRVPCSGAVRGFKGDLIVSVGNRDVSIEVKCRKDEFKPIYALFDRASTVFCNVIFNYEGIGILVTEKFQELGFHSSILGGLIVSEYKNIDDKKAVKKLASLSKYLQTCDCLAIKIDRKPYLFIRYLA